MQPRCPERANGNPAAARPPIDWERIAAVRRRPALPARVAGAILQVFRSIVCCSSPRLAGFRGTELTRSRFHYRRCSTELFLCLAAR
jgi:hypothetical protein